MTSLALGRGNRKGRELQKLKKRLEAIADLPTNRTCADCPEAEPAWASFLVKVSADKHNKAHIRQGQDQEQQEQQQLAVICCAQCSSYHAELGTSTCIVKNINKVDDWSDAEVEALELSGGNTKVNKILEAKLCPAIYNKAVILEDPGEDATARQGFISHKYQKLSYLDWQLYQAHLEIVARIKHSSSSSSLVRASSTNALRRCRTCDAAPVTTGEHLKKPKKLSAGGGDSDDSEPGYGLPNHLGVTKPRSKSSQNLLNKIKHTGRQGGKTTSNKGMPKARSHKDLVSCGSGGADTQHGGKASATTTKPTSRRYRRKSSGATPEAKKGFKASIRPSTSTPCSISRWGAGGADDATGTTQQASCSRKTTTKPRTSGRDRWNTSSSPEPSSNHNNGGSSSSKKNFTWNTTTTNNTHKKTSNKVTDIAALREICIPKYSGASDEVLQGLATGIPCPPPSIMVGGDDASTCTTVSTSKSSSPKKPCRVVSDDDLSGRQNNTDDRIGGIMVPSITNTSSITTTSSLSTRRSSLRMPCRVLSDGDDSSVESNNNMTSSTFPSSTSAAAAIQLLASRRSMPTLALSHLLPVVQQQDEDSIRNPYGVSSSNNNISSNSDSNLNFEYPVGRRHRTCFDEPPLLKAKYGIIKPKYGSETSSDSNDTDTEDKEKRSGSGSLPRSTKADTTTLERLNSIKEDLPTLGWFLQAQPEQPKRVLGERSVGTLSTGDDSDILGIGSIGIAKSNGPKLTRKGTVPTLKPPRPPSQAVPKPNNNGKGRRGSGGLWNHLNTKSTKISPLKALDALASGNISVVSGFSFHSDTSDDSMSVGKATKTSYNNNRMRRGTSCSGLRGVVSNLNDSGFSSRSSIGLACFEDSFSSAGFSSRLNRSTNAVW